MKKTISNFILLTLLGVLHAFGQAETNDWTQQVKDNFNWYSQNTLQEKLFIQTDKTAYATGELLWFKVYNVDGVFFKPVDISKVVYAELLDKNQIPVFQTKIAMKDGTGNGSVYLPVALSTGNYTLRAYTSWMKNFGPDFYFEKNLVIVNPLKVPEKTGVAEQDVYDVQFFPEGGQLVEGITSVVAFKGTDKWGKGLAFKGAILDQKNDTLVRFAPFKFGMGHFTFKPEAGSSYHAVINTGKEVIAKDMPPVNKNGYVMNLDDIGSGKLSITVTSNLPSENIYLFAQTRKIIKLVETRKVADGKASFIIDRDKLGDGISQFTIFNEAKQPVCERLYFKTPVKKLAINLTSNHVGFNQRKKVSLNIDTKNQDNKLVSANMSLSVYRLDSLQLNEREHILSYLWLKSDLRGVIEDADYYFEHTDEAADNLMLTQGWRRFDWHDIDAKKIPEPRFLPEFNGPIITARIINQTTQKPEGDVTGYLGVVGKFVQLAAAKSDTLGRLFFNMHKFYGRAELVAETNTELDTNYHIDILSPFSDQFTGLRLPPLTVTSNLQPTFEDLSLSMQVQNIYHTAGLWQFNDPHADTSAFYGPATRSYLLDNYTRFITIEEVMREYIHEVNITHVNNHFHIKVLNEKGFLAGVEPMVLLDGIPFFNMNKVFAVDPLKIRKLEVVPYDYRLGPSYEHGIFSFTSYKSDLAGAQIDPHAVIIDYEGLQKQRKFYMPVYDTELQSASHLPDLRNVLYWQPQLSTNETGKASVSFYTSDQAGRYIGIIQGITANGEAGSQTISFDVK